MAKRLFSRALKRLSPGDWMPLLCRADDRSTVTITFDDGPSPATTPLILDMLRHHRTTATFFLCAERAERYADLARQIVEEGHPVHSHGYLHRRAEHYSSASLRADLARAEEVLSRFRATPSPYLLRLPYGSGHGSSRIHRAVRSWRRDTQLVHWRHTFNDAELATGCDSAAALRTRCAAAIAPLLADPGLPGSILLLHESPFGVDDALASMVGPTLLEILLDHAAAGRFGIGGLGARSWLPVVNRYVRTVRA